jgi:UDP-N-acetylmuramate dehydrogenase
VSSDIQKQVPLAPLTWWKIGGPAEFFAAPKTVDDLRNVLLWTLREQQTFTVLGGGSNVLIADAGIEGLVISMRDLRHVTETRMNGRLQITALAGTPKSDVTKIFLREKLAPALFLCGLPGDLGGGVVMNAGVGEDILPREFVEIVDEITVLRPHGHDVEKLTFKKADLHWQYRRCSGWQPGVVAEVQLSWPLQPDDNIMALVKSATRSRLQRQPLEFPSCGSVFKNPQGHKAGALIEKSGLKGFQMGGLQVSEKHANFIVNKASKGTAREARQLIEHVQKTVFDKTGVQLQPEVQMLGKW